MRTTIATLTVATLIMITATCAQAAPTLVNVRIEGISETLFEGPILTEGHYVEASSDSEERRCDGINPLDPQNKTPGPTPTASAVDAMNLIGETFDGEWYPGYHDYFITRWGPDREEEGMSWGILVNNVFTNVGGCQYELGTGDEVLWAYNAFGDRPFLALFAAGDTSGARSLTTTAKLNKPFEVEVLDYSDDAEDTPPARPERTGSAPFEGADVSPVLTSPNGFERVETESPTTVTTNAQGKASITFTEPGWHRIKATALGAGGKESAIRSNRLDVCVPAEGESGCGAPPAEDQARTVQRTVEEIKKEEEMKHEEEIKLQEEETQRQEEAGLAPTPQSKAEIPPATSSLAVLVATPLVVSAPPAQTIKHSPKPAAKRRSLVSCRGVRDARAGSRGRASRKCKVTTPKRSHSKRRPRSRRDNR